MPAERMIDDDAEDAGVKYTWSIESAIETAEESGLIVYRSSETHILLDPMREALAIAMFRDGKDEPSVLFRPPQKRKK